MSVIFFLNFSVDIQVVAASVDYQKASSDTRKEQCNDQLLDSLIGNILVESPLDMAFKQPLEILRVTPNSTGTTQVKQITITFDKPVVAIGEMAVKKADNLVTITPSIDCEWRWLNVTTLSCRLNEKKVNHPPS